MCNCLMVCGRIVQTIMCVEQYYDTVSILCMYSYIYIYIHATLDHTLWLKNYIALRAITILSTSRLVMASYTYYFREASFIKHP